MRLMPWKEGLILDKYKVFAKATAVRAIRTFFQAIVAGIGTTAIAIGSINWGVVLGTAATAAVLSVATSIATGLPEVEE